MANKSKEIVKKYQVNNITVPEMLINGNEKIGKGVYHFSTYPTTKTYFSEKWNITIQGTCPCDCVGCYGTKGNYNFKSTKDALAIRTYIARTNLDYLVDNIISEIKKHNIKYVRIHATGDFFSTDYVKAWIKIATECSDCYFWTYTKASFPELETLNNLDNVNIVSSIIPGKGFNFGHCNYILDTYNELKTAGEDPYICKCGIDKNQHCNNCTACSTHKYVLFLEHSTGYKAEKDPDFVNIRELIANQESK